MTNWISYDQLFQRPLIFDPMIFGVHLSKRSFRLDDISIINMAG